MDKSTKSNKYSTVNKSKTRIFKRKEPYVTFYLLSKVVGLFYFPNIRVLRPI